MWANTCWGFFGLAVSFALAGLSMIGTPAYAAWGTPLFSASIICGFLSAVCFSWPLLQRFKWFREGFWPRMVPLHDGARKVLESIDGSVMATAARSQSNAPNGPLCYIAEKLFLDETPIYGKQVQSSILAKIPNDILFANSFSKNASEIEDNHTHQTMFTDLKVNRNDLKIAIAKLQEKHHPSPD